MYDGTIDINKAAKSPASGLFEHSLVKKYVEIDVRPANTGAMKTHTFLMSIGKDRKSEIHLMEADVTMMPGKMVPPMTRPSGYQDSLSNQFQKSYTPFCAKYLVVRKLNQGSNS